MKTLKNSDGFSPVHTLLILVIVGIVGFTGWYVWNANNDANKNLESTNTTSPTVNEDLKTKDTQTNKTTEWFEYSSPDGKYSIKLPDGWRLDVTEGGSAPYAVDAKKISYVAGTPATVTPTKFAGDILNTAFAMSDGEKGFFGQEPRGSKQSVFKTTQGLEVTRYDFTVVNEPEDLPSGMVRHEYRIVSNGKYFQVVHDVQKGETDQAELVEDAIRTLELN